MIISIINSKGGVGKTVTCVHLGAALARAGFSTLLIDVDMQHGLTNYFNLNTEGITTTDVLLRGANVDEAAQIVRPGLRCVPASRAIESAEIELSTLPGAELRLRRAMKNAGRVDFVLIDCPSGWGAVTRNALLASGAFVVPINSEPASVTCAVDTEAGARELGAFYDDAPALLGVLLTRFRQTNAARAVASQTCRQWGKSVFETRIRQAERVNDLSIRRETASDQASGVVGEDYESLAREVIARCHPKQTRRAPKSAAKTTAKMKA